MVVKLTLSSVEGHKWGTLRIPKGDALKFHLARILVENIVCSTHCRGRLEESASSNGSVTARY